MSQYMALETKQVNKQSQIQLQQHANESHNREHK